MSNKFNHAVRTGTRAISDVIDKLSANSLVDHKNNLDQCTNAPAQAAYLKKHKNEILKLLKAEVPKKIKVIDESDFGGENRELFKLRLHNSIDRLERQYQICEETEDYFGKPVFQEGVPLTECFLHALGATIGDTIISSDDELSTLIYGGMKKAVSSIIHQVPLNA